MTKLLVLVGTLFFLGCGPQESGQSTSPEPKIVSVQNNDSQTKEIYKDTNWSVLKIQTHELSGKPACVARTRQGEVTLELYSQFYKAEGSLVSGYLEPVVMIYGNSGPLASPFSVGKVKVGEREIEMRRATLVNDDERLAIPLRQEHQLNLSSLLSGSVADFAVLEKSQKISLDGLDLAEAAMQEECGYVFNNL